MITVAALIMAILTFSKCTDKRVSEPYNIILITIDDLGWSDLGCYGSQYYLTPNIDALAAKSVVFRQAYAAAAVCSPTRSALMTGLYPARTGITDWIRAEFQGGDTVNVNGFDTLDNRPWLTPTNPFHLELEAVTIAEKLSMEGYRTAHIGKWHLGTRSYYPEKQGFDINIGGCDYGQPPSYFDPYAYYPSIPGRDTLYGIPHLIPRKKGEYLTDREAQEALDFIGLNQNQPFFLNLCHYAVHTPIQSKPGMADKFRNINNPQGSPEYAAMVQSVDESLGSIMEYLRSQNLEQRTIILFTSDNGGLKGPQYTDNTPLRSGKGYPYEGGIRVPLILYHPDLSAPHDVQSPVISMDIFETIRSMAQVTPDKESDSSDGVDLSHFVSAPDTINRENLIWHFPHYRGQDIVPYSILRHKDWKLIRFYDSEIRYELYNLAQDMEEKYDLAPELNAFTISLNAILIDELNKVNAKIPKRNPYYQNASI